MLDFDLNIIVIFSPHHVYLFNLIENLKIKHLQKNFLGLQNMCYQDKLNLYSVEPLETCRLHSDLILMHKIINGAIREDVHNCVFTSYSTARGNK